MIRTNSLILTAALSLIMSAILAQAAPPVIITSDKLPFTISTPGTYVLTGDLSYPPSDRGTPPAITILETNEGSISLDLKGFTITGGVNYGGSVTCIQILGNNPNKYPITIENGTLTAFPVGIQAYSSFIGTPDFQISHVTIKNIVFNVGFSEGVAWDGVSNSTIENCQFFSGGIGPVGIADFNSTGGNVYYNINCNISYPLIVGPGHETPPLILNNYQPDSFAPIKTNPSTTKAPPPVTISSLPLSITTPGNYKLTGNLSGEIIIYEPIAGPVIVDLNGFTITGGISIQGSTGQFPLKIQNGTITPNLPGLYGLTTAIIDNSVSNIVINEILFNQNLTLYPNASTGVLLEGVSNSIISNCQFTGPPEPRSDDFKGILDISSPKGNSYKNNSFQNMFFALFIDNHTDNTALKINSCKFAPPQ